MRSSAPTLIVTSILLLGLASGGLAAEPLFDGASLAGWSGNTDLWKVEDGAIVGNTMPDGIRRNEFLFSAGEYENFILRLRFHYTGGNSGVQIRSASVGDGDALHAQGYQADIGEGYHGCLYDEDRRGMLVQSDLDLVKRFLKVGDWNDYEIRCIGNEVTLRINELRTAHYIENDESIARRGHIALQLHSGPGMEIRFRDIEIEEIKPRRVLFTTHAAGFAHSSRPTARETIKKLARDSGYFEAVVTDDVALINPRDLENFDAVGFYTTGDKDRFPLSEENRNHLIEWVRQGHAFFGTHSATDTYKDWEPYWEMIGGSFSGHPWGAGGPAVTIDVEDPAHPSARHLDNQWEIQDEIYQFTNYSRERLHVILSLNPKEHDKGSTEHGDYPVAWCREFGEGKVFYTSLGHREDVWTNPAYQEHLLGGIFWALEIDGYEGSAVPGRAKAPNDWVALFDGQTMSGWKPNRVAKATWEIVDGGVLRGTGAQGHLFSPRTYRNFHYSVEARIFEDSNSGMYFRTRFDEDAAWPRGMEAQVNSSHTDPKRTGTLYGYESIYRPLSKNGEWFRQEVIAVDESIVIKVNGEVTVARRVPFNRRQHAPSGHFAFQQHHQGSKVEFRNVKVRELPE